MKRIFTNGCFDGLHAGHIHLLREASKLGEELIVGLNSDDSVRRIKGAGRPRFSLESRMESLYRLYYVSSVRMFTEDTPEAIIRELKPDLIVKGEDWKGVPRPWDDVCPTVFIPRIPR